MTLNFSNKYSWIISMWYNNKIKIKIKNWIREEKWEEFIHKGALVVWLDPNVLEEPPYGCLGSVLMTEIHTKFIHMLK